MSSAQLSLFDGEASPSPTPPIAPAAVRERPIKVQRPAKELRTEQPRLVTLDDMPSYPSDVVDMVDNAVANLPAELIWLTYRDIERHFGISRSTTARRLKDELVPGIRFLHGRMLDDGAVRRLDRIQVRWLLLAVRAQRTH
jgi:hypothetical protein